MVQSAAALHCRSLPSAPHRCRCGHFTDVLHGIGESLPDGLSLGSSTGSQARTQAGGASTRLALTNGSGGSGEGNGDDDANGSSAAAARMPVDADDAGALVELARVSLSKADGDRVEGILRAGIARFKSSVWLHVMMARYLGSLRGNRHLEATHLARATRAGGE